MLTLCIFTATSDRGLAIWKELSKNLLLAPQNSEQETYEARVHMYGLYHRKICATELKPGNVSHQSSPVLTSPQDSLCHRTQKKRRITPEFTCTDFTTGIFVPQNSEQEAYHTRVHLYGLHHRTLCATELRVGSVSHQSSPVPTSPQDTLCHRTQNRKSITPEFTCTDFTTGLFVPQNSEEKTYHTRVHLYGLYHRTLCPTELRAGSVSHQSSPVRTSPQDSLCHRTQNRKRITSVFTCTDFSKGLRLHSVWLSHAVARERAALLEWHRSEFWALGFRLASSSSGLYGVRSNDDRWQIILKVFWS
jgi:hypothetical protein